MYSTIFLNIYTKLYRALKKSSMNSPIHTQVQCPYRWGGLRILVQRRSARNAVAAGPFDVQRASERDLLVEEQTLPVSLICTLH